MSKLVNRLIRNGYLKTDSIIDAFSEIRRIEFVPREMELQAEADIALPIGCGQTISQPLTVATMFELLDPQKKQKILDVGSGSGWTTALLSFIVGREGRVISIERKGELAEMAKRNVNKFGYIKKGIASIIEGDGSKGLAKEAPYDRILVSAEVEEIPNELKKQLKKGGKMVVPVKNVLTYLEKRDEDDFYEEKYPGFSFVPLIIDE